MDAHDILCLLFIFITKNNKTPSGMIKRCCQPALMKWPRWCSSEQNIIRRLNHWANKLHWSLSHLPGWTFQIPFLFEDLNSFWAHQGRPVECRRGLNSVHTPTLFPPYTTFPAAWLAAIALNPPLWHFGHQTHRILSHSYWHCCFSVHAQSKNSSFIIVGSQGDDTLKSPWTQTYSVSVASAFSQLRLDSPENVNLTSEWTVPFGLWK